MDPNAPYYYALSTIAQCAAALAALIGFLALWRLDRLQDEDTHLENELKGLLVHTRERIRGLCIQNINEPQSQPNGATYRLQIIPRITRWNALPGERWRLMGVRTLFLAITLIVILAPAIVGIIHVEWLKTWPWAPTALYVASALLAIAPAGVVNYVARKARRGSRALLSLALLPLLASPAKAGPVRCQTYHEPTLNRLMTIYDDGTRATSYWNRTLERWQTIITPPPGQTCSGQLNPRTQQVEVRYR
jgi:hypothetical protein